MGYGKTMFASWMKSILGYLRTYPIQVTAVAMGVCVIGCTTKSLGLAGMLTVLAVVAYRLVIKRKASLHQRQRELQLLRELPQLLEIVALAVRAGLSFEAALRLYIRFAPSICSVELTYALEESRLGLLSLRESLVLAAHRLHSTELASVFEMIFESIHHGVPLAHVLHRQIEPLRLQLKAQTQEELERAPVWMLIPTATLMLPAMLLAVVGPLLASAFMS